MPRQGYCLLVLSLAGVLVGCGRGEGIETYVVPKPKVAPAVNVAASTDGNVGKPARLIGTIIPQGEYAWFFKLMGPEKPVSDQMKSFLDMTQSIDFDDQNNPTWKLPEGWSREAGSGMRYATLKIDTAEEPLEVSVIKLPGNTPGDLKYTLDNVNRWRGQVGLGPITESELHQGGDLKEETRKITLNDGTEATLVSFAGTMQASSMSRAPFAGGGASRPMPPAQNKPAPKSGLSYQTPTGWEQGATNAFRKASFKVSSDGNEVEITAIDLPASANELLPNVNRWRGQVGLEPVDEAQLGETMKSIDIDGSSGHYVVLVGPEETTPRKAILGVIVEKGETAWFFKMTGDASLALEQQANFESFLKSIRFSSN
ncbi:hypothetical protein [Calycomorphotria hydatis]|uniref:Uncharacterized protein n=1 Tax=Calycomorphotria hydatis TaxID=2528027 RepID=A0A517T4Y4_9PLAN|nr:hypothetical protein [Calycomorphotria hydatis]QDT63435.1 hypothetical protein V22_06560 [Calycomorphotria hydatis]